MKKHTSEIGSVPSFKRYDIEITKGAGTPLIETDLTKFITPRLLGSGFDNDGSAIINNVYDTTSLFHNTVIDC